MKKSATPPIVDAAQGDGAPPVSFEAALAELEELTDALEAGQTSLDELLSGYRRAAFLLKHCRQQLQCVEDQVKLFDAGSVDDARMNA